MDSEIMERSYQEESEDEDEDEDDEECEEVDDKEEKEEKEKADDDDDDDVDAIGIYDFGPETVQSFQAKVAEVKYLDVNISTLVKEIPVDDKWRDSIVGLLKQSSNLCEVNFYYMTKYSLEPFVDGLAEKHPEHKAILLNLCGALEDEESPALLVELLQKTSRVQELHVEVDYVLDFPSTFHAAFEGLSKNKSVLKACFILGFEQKLKKPISSVIAQNNTLQTLILYDIPDIECIPAMFNALAVNRTLTTFHASFCEQMDELSSKAMLKCCQENKTLTDFAWTSDCDNMDVAKTVFKAIGTLDAKTKTSWSLRQWDITDEEGKTIKDFTTCIVNLIQQSQALVEFNVEAAFEPVHINQILKAAERNLPSLKRLQIKHSGVSGDRFTPGQGKIVVDQLIESLPSISSLEELDVETSLKAVDERKDDILSALSENKCLKKFGFGPDWWASDELEPFDNCIQKNHQGTT